jgi:hypothetical protein
MNQEQKVLEMPTFSQQDVQALYNYAMNEMATKWGSEVVKFIERVAIEQDKAKVANSVEEVKTEEISA